MHNKYIYNGKTYCQTDLSEELGDDYGGDLWDLFDDLKEDELVESHETYTLKDYDSGVYFEMDKLIEENAYLLDVEVLD